MQPTSRISPPRRYRDSQDLKRMFALLAAGRQANNGTYYVHPGDLSWWLFYQPLEINLWDHLYLWDDPKEPSRILGWGLLSPGWHAFDVFVQPELRGTALAESMSAWAELEIEKVTRQEGTNFIRTIWIFEDDRVQNAWLKKRGFTIEAYSVYLTRPLLVDLPGPTLPPGFQLRHVGRADEEARAWASYGAFESEASFPDYLNRYLKFRSSEVYTPELDIITVAPGGRVGSFCICWLDEVNRIGLFEPVGTHPDFQRLGLARAVMLEGFRRLQARGMLQAAVVTSELNEPAVHLYQSLGFQVTNRSCHHVRRWSDSYAIRRM